MNMKIKYLSFILSFIMIVDMTANHTAFAQTHSSNGRMKNIAQYATGLSNEAGGVAEIVKYNAENRRIYLVNGAEKSVDIVNIGGLRSSEESILVLEKRLDIITMGAENDFICGDITSVDVNTELDLIALAVQDEDYSKKGSIVILNYDGEYIRHFNSGIQPDMIKFSPDGNYLLTADEGEPRNGYSEDTVDPMGSITMIDMRQGIDSAQVDILDFSLFDSRREMLVADMVLIKPDTMPSVDLEPEYITVSEDNRYAYITLQENNAIATIDLQRKEIVTIKGLGYKDFSVEQNKLDVYEDKKAKLTNENLYGIYMPDGCDIIRIDGKDYLLTANEGDRRDWGSESNDYLDEDSYVIPGTDYEIDTLSHSERDGLIEGNQYLYGARSFSIWDAVNMTQVYDSGSDFEAITAEIYPKYFNSSNNKTKIDSRSSKKGPEPESVAAITIGEHSYAFIALERIGGVMMYDITNPTQAEFCDYINLREFNGGSVEDSGSLAPEGLCIIEVKDSPTNQTLVLVANEVSGTVDVLEINDMVNKVKDTSVSAVGFPSETGNNTNLYLFAGACAILAIVFLWVSKGENKRYSY
jgi:DNA-binding beta-propeller fold protein YncE